MKRLVNAQSHFTQQDMSERVESREKIAALKTHAKRFQVQGNSADAITADIERDQEISKNNAMLLKNLLEISHGKRTSVPGPRTFGTATVKRAMSSKPKSLNEGVRKREMERIARENFEMVKRLHKG